MRPVSLPYCSHRALVRGISIVELMVAVTLSLIILAVISQVFVGSKATYATEEGLARIQESGRFTLDTLANDIRQAGYHGCGRMPLNTPELVTSQVASFVPSIIGIQGYRYVGAGGNNVTADWRDGTLGPNNNPGPGPAGAGFFPVAPPTGAVADALAPNSDMLVVRYATSNGIQLAADMGSPADQLSIRESDVDAFSPNSLWMVSNCDGLDTFVVTSITGSGDPRLLGHTSPQNSTNNLHQAFDQGSELVQYNSYIYYVANTSRPDGTGGFVRALFRRAAPSYDTPEELVEGVENLQIFYGLLGNGPASNYNSTWYVPANQISVDFKANATSNWTLVSSVRLGVVASTADRISTDAENTLTAGASAGLNVLGITTDTMAPYLDNYLPSNPADGRPRRVFSYVIQTRQPPR
jgi:type IV pilus assembly protein PilW